MKVFYVTTFSSNVFYVHAENAAAAKEHLLEQVKKYYFKRELSGDENMRAPKTLGDNIIVELGIHKSILDAANTMTIEDISAMAYVFATGGNEYWKEWDITLGDVVAV
jgi:hypothetical protein